MPDWKEEIAMRLRSLKLAPPREAEITEELAQHLEDRYQELIAGGANEKEARRVALEELSDENLLARGLRRVEKEVPQEPLVPGEGGGNNFLASLWQDVRYGIRMLRKSPGFAAAAVIVLALGIGANTAIFSVVNAVLLRPLPFSNPDRLVQLWHTPPQASFPGMTRFPLSAANYLDWKSQNHVFEQTAIYSFARYNLTGIGQPEVVQAGSVEPSFFAVLGIPPMLGRVFASDEDQPGRGNIVILSHAFWQDHFGRDPHVIGRSIEFDGKPFTVVGVMGPQFRRPPLAQVWTPLVWTNKERSVRGEHHFLVVARLRRGVDLKQAQTEMNTISSRLEQQYPSDNRGWGAMVVPLREETVGKVRPALLVLLGAVAFVLLIACANVANLVLAETLARQKEIAIRTALGASRARVLQQVLTETVLLAIAGGALGLLLGRFGLDLIVHFLASKLPRATEISLDARVLGFTLLVSVLTGLVAGFLPAWRLTKTDVNDALKQGLGRAGADSGSRRTRNVLVAAEVALSLMLLIGAGLMIRSLWLLRSVDPGFDPHGVLKMTVGIGKAKFTDPAQQSSFYDQVLQRVRALPGVESAGVIDDLPLSGGSHQPVAVEGRPVVAMADQPEVDVRVISPGYVRAMRIPVLRGRDVNDRDTGDRPAAILISEAMAKRFWPNEDPLGQHVTLTFFPDRAREIVGIVGDVKQDALNGSDPNATLYVPMAQITAATYAASTVGPFRAFSMALVVRTITRPTSLVTAVANAVHQLDPATPLLDVVTLEDFVAESLSQERFNMLLLATFAGLAVVLAAVGIYSVLAYGVRRRVREIGIRMALGAQNGDVLRTVIGDGTKLTLIGVAIGIAGALALTRSLSSLLYGVRPTDPLTFIVVSFILTSVALLASYIPARRATRIDPMVALRYE